MKRSEVIEHIKADIEEMLKNMKNRPSAAKYMPERYANEILDMLEGFGMLPPHNKSAQAMSGSYDESIGCCIWEPEND